MVKKDDFYHILGYYNLSLNLIRSYGACLLVWAVCHLLLALHTSIMSAWFSFMGSRQSHTMPLGSGTMAKLFHYSTVSSIPTGATIC